MNTDALFRELLLGKFLSEPVALRDTHYGWDRLFPEGNDFALALFSPCEVRFFLESEYERLTGIVKEILGVEAVCTHIHELEAVLLPLPSDSMKDGYGSFSEKIERIVEQSSRAEIRIYACRCDRFVRNPADLSVQYEMMRHRIRMIAFRNAGDAEQSAFVVHMEKLPPKHRNDRGNTALREMSQKMFQSITSYSFDAARAYAGDVIRTALAMDNLDIELFTAGLFNSLELAAYMLGFRIDKAGEVTIRMPHHMVEFQTAHTAEEIRSRMLDCINYIEANLYLGVNRSESMATILRYIESNYHDAGMTAKEIANKFHKNISYLSRQFKAETGVNLSVYIRNLRLQKAKELLVGTNHTVEQVAYMSGWGSAKNFHKMFLQTEGTSPQKYRITERMNQ